MKSACAQQTICTATGQSNPPNHLSMFLEVSDSRAGLGEDWSCFVSHKLAVMHHRGDRDRWAGHTAECTYVKIEPAIWLAIVSKQRLARRQC